MPFLSSRRRAVALAAVPSPARSRARFGLVAAAGLALSCAGAAPAFAADTQAPSQPGTLTTSDTGPGTTTLAWGASTDDVGVTEYEIYDGAKLIGTEFGFVTQTSITVTVQGGPHTYAFNVRAKDAAGNLSAPSNTVSRGTCAPSGAGSANLPTDLAASAVTDTTATISWKRGAQDWCHQIPTGYQVVVDGVSQPSVAASQRSTVLTGLKPGTSYTIGVRALPASFLEGWVGDTPIVVSTTGINPTDGSAPTAPGSPTAASGTDGVTVRWGASADNVGVKEYDLFDAAGGLIKAVDGGTTAIKLPRTSNTPSPAKVAARDAAGNLSARIPITPSTCPVLGPNAASPPRNVAVTPFPQDGRQFAAVTWDAPLVLDCTYATGYVDVFLGEDNAAPTQYGTGDLSQGPPTPSDTGFSLVLEAGHTYKLYTQGRAYSDGDYVSSLPTPTISFNADGPPVPVAVPYAVKGSVALKNNVKGSVPLAGSATGLVDATGAFTAPLALATSKANLTALGVLPVAATVKVVTTAPVTGQLTGSSLTALAKVRIKITSLTVFGMQLVTGPNCQTTQVSNVKLVSKAFTPGIGGTLTGAFSIGTVSGCGALTDLVSALATGGGNVLTLKLAA